MEGTAERTVNIYTNPGKTLAEKINDHLALTKQSIAGLAKDVNYSRTAVSRYLSGKYDSNATGLEEKLAEWYAQRRGDAVKMPEGAKGRTPRRPQFLESRDATAVLGVCQSCQEYIGLGIVVGRSGYGKTHTLKQYAKLSKVAYIECDDTMSSRDLVEAIERSLGLPSGYGTIWKRVNGIREFCNTHGEPGRLLRLPSWPVSERGRRVPLRLRGGAGGDGGNQSSGLQSANRMLPPP